MNQQLARHIADCLSEASWIRRMFEEGNQLREKFGAENVFDFSLGNPHLEPPAALTERLRALAEQPRPGGHRYMPNPGFFEVRSKVAAAVAKAQGMAVPTSHVVMVCGAASGLNVALRSLLNPGEKVAVFAPIFAEYPFYVMHAGGVCQHVPTTADFDLDVNALAETIDASTRVVLINSPNNPTGRVYPEQTIRALAEVLKDKSKQYGRPIVLIADEPYRRLVYDGVEVPALFPHYEQTIIVTSFSKDLGLAGERIGYLAVHPRFAEATQVLAGMIFCLRTLGFVNAPALMQLLIADLLDASVDVDAYRRNRDLFYGGLTDIGYEVVKPQGAFYLFPRSPLADDRQFIAKLLEHQVLAVPGLGFAQPGFFRLSYAVEPHWIERAMPRFRRAFEECRE